MAIFEHLSNASRASQAQFPEQPRGRMVADPEPAQTRLVAQRGGQETLPGSTFAGDVQVLVLTDPAAVG